MAVKTIETTTEYRQGFKEACQVAKDLLAIDQRKAKAALAIANKHRDESVAWDDVYVLLADLTNAD